MFLFCLLAAFKSPVSKDSTVLYDVEPVQIVRKSDKIRTDAFELCRATLSIQRCVRQYHLERELDWQKR